MEIYNNFKLILLVIFIVEMIIFCIVFSMRLLKKSIYEIDSLEKSTFNLRKIIIYSMQNNKISNYFLYAILATSILMIFLP
jgi:hypothetical protein